ncbi:WG repeat-containing protein [Persicitalea jodogahamensis]|uniref:WG repeat-containing protein n=1 Tax=Persicitalea jodogahamensis TaxID=402147 RepID=A0A8J3D3A9_9BACT|nr:WG repeat-containing protein [Persicitalea jodogahamensis]GHB67451.1 hypothetical protein GCM10007390_20950 [Persicitalea jodogahamensis]
MKNVIYTILVLMVFIEPANAQSINSQYVFYGSDKIAVDSIFPAWEGIKLFKTRSNRWGAIDENEKVIIYPKYRILTYFKEDLAIFWKDINNNGFVDREGNEVHKGSYTEIRPFEGGLSEVWHSTGQKFRKEDGYTFENNPFDVRRNYLNRAFDLLIPQKYDSVGVYIHKRLRVVKKTNKFGFLDENGKEIIPPILDDIDLDSVYFWKELRRIGIGGKFGYLNTQKKELAIDFSYNETLPSNSNITWVKVDQTWYLIDMNLRVLKEADYKSVRWIVPSKVSAAQTDLGYLLIDSDGHELCDQKYDFIFMADEGVAPVMKNGKFGYIDLDGNQIVAPIYEKVFHFKNGQGLVLDKYAYWYINQNGEKSWHRMKPSVLINILIVILLCPLCLWTYRLTRNYW